MGISAKLSTKSVEEEQLNTNIGLKTSENIFEAPKLFKGFSDIREEEPKEDPFMDLFSNEQSFKKFGRMEEESEWNQGMMEEFDIFSLSNNQREDFLGESRAFGGFGST